MIHLVRSVTCTALHIPNRSVLFSSPAANHRHTIFLLVIVDVNCFHIFGTEAISMLLFKLWFTLNTCNSDVDKFHEIIFFSITQAHSQHDKLQHGLLALHPISYPIPVPHSTTAWQFCAVNLQESVLLQRKDFNLLHDLDLCNYYKL